MPGARYHEIHEGGSLLNTIDDLTTRLFDGQTSPMYKDAAKTMPVTTQGDTVARVVGKAFEYEAQGSVTYNALGAINTSSGCIQTITTVPVITNNRTSFAIIQVKSEHTGYVYGPRSGTNGWAMRTDGRGADDDGIFEVFHWGGVDRPIENNIVADYGLTTPILAFWHQTPTGGVLNIDGVEKRIVDGTGDALGTNLIEAIGGLPGGSGLFDGLVYMAGQAQDLDAAGVTELEALLLERLSEIKSIQLNLETFETVFQRDTATNLGTVRAVGEWTGDGDVDVQYDGGAWITTSVTGGRFRHHFEDTPEGEGLLKVRALGGALEREVLVGVGDHIVGEGQSLMLGSADNTRTYTGGLLGRFWNPDDNVPVDPPDVSDKAWQPDFLNDYITNTGRRCMFTATGRGSTAIEHFLPDADPFPDPTASENLYQRGLRRALEAQMINPDTYDPLTDGPVCLCVFWWQGTQDVYNAATTAEYEASLRAYITARNADLGVQVFVPIYQDIDSPSADEVDEEAIREAQRNVRGDNEPGITGHPNAESGPDWSGTQFDTGDRVHIATDADHLLRSAEISASIRAVYP